MNKLLFLTGFIFFNTLQAGYCFKNDSETTRSVTMFDQDGDLVIDNFNLQANQELILSCKYIRKQKISALKILCDSSEDPSAQNGVTIKIQCPNCYYLLYNLKGKLLSYEDSKTAVETFKTNVSECLFIKRGFIQKGFFLRNIEEHNNLFITLNDKGDEGRQLLIKYPIAPNEEIYCSNSFLQSLDIEQIMLRLQSDFRSNRTGKRIQLSETEIASETISFDSQIIYPLMLGLQNFPYTHGLNQCNQLTQRPSYKHPFFKHFLAKTLFDSVRTTKPKYLKKLRRDKKEKYGDIILENCSSNKQEITILDQNKELVINSITLFPQQTIHLASSYLKGQSIHRLKLITHTLSEVEEKEKECVLGESVIKSTLALSRKTYENYGERYTTFGDFLNSINFLQFRTAIQPRLSESIYIKRGFPKKGYYLRNIQKNDLILSIKDNHSTHLFSDYSLPSNGEIFFPNKFLSRQKIEYILVTAQMQSSSVGPQNNNDKITLIKTPSYNFDSQKVYHLALGLKAFALQYPLTQFDEPSTKPLTVAHEIADYLYQHTVFYEPRVSIPVHLKSHINPDTQIEKEVEGPISPSTKV